MKTSITIYFALMVLVAFHSIAAETSISEGSKFDEFIQMPTNQQKDLIAKEFRSRLDKAKNVYYALEMKTRNTNSEEDTNKDFNVTYRRNYERWQLDNSYLVKMDMFEHADKSPIQWVTSAFNLKEGRGNGTFRSKDDENLYGAINTEQDRAITEDLFLYWFKDSYFPEGVQEKNGFFFDYVLKGIDDWQITAEKDKPEVRLKTNFLPDYSFMYKSCTGHIELVLDVEKQFMPVKVEYRWDAMSKTKKHWRTERFTVEKSENADGVWMPIMFSNIVNTSNGPDIFTITDVKINSIKFGDVTKNDVTLVFPENTIVTDNIDGISYKTNARGKPIQSTIEPLYGLDPSQVNMPKPKSKVRPVLIIVGLLMIAFALYSQFKKRKQAT